jgi:hypothetical protein
MFDFRALVGRAVAAASLSMTIFTTTTHPSRAQPHRAPGSCKSLTDYYRIPQ